MPLSFLYLLILVLHKNYMKFKILLTLENKVLLLDIGWKKPHPPGQISQTRNIQTHFGDIFQINFTSL